jgi:two-component system, OmpR family, phosphate regulon response regulator PhoB
MTPRAQGRARNLNFYYGDFQALKNINMPIYDKKVTALIGPPAAASRPTCAASTACTTCIRATATRARSAAPGQHQPAVRGRRSDRGAHAHQHGVPEAQPFPKSIYENVAYGLRVRGETQARPRREGRAGAAGAALWDEVKDRLHELAFNLSGGQQQRLCIARALATDPEMLLFDEPTSALDPIATASIEELIADLKAGKVTILIVTHNMQQAARVSDYTAYMYLGELIEFGADRHDLHQAVKNKQTEDYITGQPRRSPRASAASTRPAKCRHSTASASATWPKPRSMVRQALDAFARLDAELAEKVIRSDRRRRCRIQVDHPPADHAHDGRPAYHYDLDRHHLDRPRHRAHRRSCQEHRRASHLHRRRTDIRHIKEGQVTPTILVVEDEPAIQELVAINLKHAGFLVVRAAAPRRLNRPSVPRCPTCVVLDWMLPGQSGVALAKKIRADERTRELPIIMLTARVHEEDKVQGLEAGADDYVTKPFSPKELVARVRAVLRRRAPHLAGEAVEIGDLALNPATHRVLAAGQPIELGPTEFRLLFFFMTHSERVYTRAQLLDEVWGDHVFIEERTVDVHIRRLRAALEPCGHHERVETVRGTGYRFRGA